MGNLQPTIFSSIGPKHNLRNSDPCSDFLLFLIGYSGVFPAFGIFLRGLRHHSCCSHICSDTALFLAAELILITGEPRWYYGGSVLVDVCIARIFERILRWNPAAIDQCPTRSMGQMRRSSSRCSLPGSGHLNFVWRIMAHTYMCARYVVALAMTQLCSSCTPLKHACPASLVQGPHSV